MDSGAGIRVFCYSGWCADEIPRAFELFGRRVMIDSIKASWKTPDRRFFDVRTADGGRYILSHDPVSGAWSITG